MLLTWRLKFPQPFVKYQALIKRLSAKEKNYLSSMLSTLEHPSVNLLTAELLDLILSDFDDHLSDFDDHLEGCCNLINLLAQQRSLNKKNINNVISFSDVDQLQRSCVYLLNHQLLSPATLDILLSYSEPEACAELIQRSCSTEPDVARCADFICKRLDVTGLKRSLTLLDLSDLGYGEESLNKLSVLSSVLGTKLAQTIFDARLRGFSDYVEAREPLSKDSALQIIELIYQTTEYNQRIECFFDFFIQFRSIPPSQKYMVEVDVAMIVTSYLELYLTRLIESIQSMSKYQFVCSMIHSLRTDGGSEPIFNEINDEVATTIEAQDLYSTRTYQVLMNEIWNALRTPQRDLRGFEDELEYKRTLLVSSHPITSALGAHGLLGCKTNADAAEEVCSDSVLDSIKPNRSLANYSKIK